MKIALNEQEKDTALESRIQAILLLGARYPDAGLRAYKDAVDLFIAREGKAWREARAKCTD